MRSREPAATPMNNSPISVTASALASVDHLRPKKPSNTSDSSPPDSRPGVRYHCIGGRRPDRSTFRPRPRPRACWLATHLGRCLPHASRPRDCLGCVQKGRPSCRDGVIKSGRTFFLHWAVNTSSNPAHTVPTGRIFFSRIPGTKVPGYHHSVPPGRSPTAPYGTGRHLRTIHQSHAAAAG